MEWWVGATCPKTLSDPWQLYIAITVCCRPSQMFKICLLNQGWFGDKVIGGGGKYIFYIPP